MAHEYTRHELSAVFGDMTAEELAALTEDIKANGLRDPIVLHDGQVLDGWHRYTAARAAGVRLRDGDFVDFDPQYDGRSVNAFVISKNLHRRQLPAEERARLAAKMLGYSPARGRPQAGAVTAEQVAAAANVSVATVKRTAPAKRGPKEQTVETLRADIEKTKAKLEKLEAALAALEEQGKPTRKRR